MTSLGIYLHIPFCRSVCPYCDFNTYAGIGDQRPAYVDALRKELRHRLSAFAEPPLISTVYFGGGTPSLLPVADVAAVLSDVRQAARLLPDTEITLEANPGTVTADRLRGFADAGINRLNVGCQSFRPHLLAGLGRLHSVDESHAVLHAAREAGFENLNIDLMFGLSRQTAEDWEADVEEALSFDPTHLSLYNLTIEEGTPFAAREAAGELPLPDEELVRHMYAYTRQRTAAAGIPAYEISNFSKPGRECRQNLLYWSGAPWLGVGAGAHGFDASEGSFGRRWWNLRAPRRYVQEVNAERLPEEGSEHLGEAEAITEALMLSLRKSTGLNRAAFSARFGFDPWVAMGDAGRRAQDSGLITVDDVLKATEDGVIIIDSLIEALSRSLDTGRRDSIVTDCSFPPSGPDTTQESTPRS